VATTLEQCVEGQNGGAAWSKAGTSLTRRVSTGLILDVAVC
jgi:hypothetical protein